ncbi:MAG: DUF692 domain-containing protein [Bdellovibrionia bacterium]
MTQPMANRFEVKKVNDKQVVPYKGFGLGLRPKHYRDVLEGGSSVSWYEVVTENFLGDGGRPLATLEKIRRDFPIALHGVSGSLGSTDDLDKTYFTRLKNLIRRFDPFIVSDHCCWTRVNGQSFHDLLPLPFTQEAARHIATQITKAQDWLGQRILIENVSSYLSFAQDEMSEWEFLTEILEAADCGLLLDINNIYVSSVNHGFDPLAYLSGIPKDRVGQIHLAGHSTNWTDKGQKYLIDTHDHPVCAEVWSLYGKAVNHFGKINTMVEWDANIPNYNVLEAEILKARNVEKQNAKQIETLPFSPRATTEIWTSGIRSVETGS